MPDNVFDGDLFLQELNGWVEGRKFRPQTGLEVSDDFFRLWVGWDPNSGMHLISVTPFFPPTPPEILESVRWVIIASDGVEVARGGFAEDDKPEFAFPQGKEWYSVRFEFVP